MGSMKSFLDYCDSLNRFTMQHPGFLYGLSAVIGSYLALFPHPALIIPFLAIWSPLILVLKNENYRSLNFRLLLGLALIAGFWVYASQTAILPKKEVEGIATLTLNRAKIQKTFFGTTRKYSANISQIVDSESHRIIGKNIPCTLATSIKKEKYRKSLGVEYQLTGILTVTKYGSYLFKPYQHNKWESTETPGFNLAEWRHHAKGSVSSYIQKHYKEETTAAFLTGISTGEFDSPEIQFAFSRFGLQHIMAISGFHFALIASFLNLVLRPFFPTRWNVLLLVLLLSSYFVFLGCGPSVLRAWISLVILLIAQLIQRNSNGVNTLGVAVLVMLLYDPLMVTQIGFQFSVLTTASILLFYKPIEQLLGIWIKKRSLGTVLNMPLLDQHGYIVLTIIKQGMALSAAVNLSAIPMTLFLFGKYPLLSLLYNLFFPFFVSISMILLILGCLESIFPYALDLFHGLNGHFTHFILGLTINFPQSFDFMIRVAPFSPFVLSLYLTGFLCVAIFLKNRIEVLTEISAF